jgi:hypothetical protein
MYCYFKWFDNYFCTRQETLFKQNTVLANGVFISAVKMPGRLNFPMASFVVA